MDRPVQSELDLIGAIYDAVLDPGLWNDTLARFQRYYGLANASLAIDDLRHSHSVLASSGVDPKYGRLIATSGPEILDLWGGPAAIMRLPLEEPLIHSEVNPRENWAGNRYYQEFGIPQGLIDQVVIGLELNPSMIAYFSMGRHISMPDFQDWQIESLRILAPHLRRAALIGNLLRVKTEAASTFEAVLNTLGSAVLLVDDTLRVVYANTQAEVMLDATQPLALVNARLELPGELAPGQFERTIRAAADADHALGPGSGIPVRRADGSGLVVHVFPLRRRIGDPAPRAVAAVFVAEPNAPLNLPLEAIRMLYDLRPAELRVFELIATGLSGRAVAENLKISPSTAHTHTVRLFDKLGLHTRAELVRFAREMSLGV